jgi:hypothetical protein
MPLAVFGFAALPAAFGIEQPEPRPKTEATVDAAPRQKQQEKNSNGTTSLHAPLKKQHAKPPDFRSFALDVAKTYVALSEAKQADTQRRQSQR